MPASLRLPSGGETTSLKKKITRTRDLVHVCSDKLLGLISSVFPTRGDGSPSQAIQ